MTEDNQVKFWKRIDKIVLSYDLVCKCERTKHKIHCPSCGREKIRGKVGTVPATIPNTANPIEVISDCKQYVCHNCAEQFNDVDWYYNCRALAKKAPKEVISDEKDKERREGLDNWYWKLANGYVPDWNDKVSFKHKFGGGMNALDDFRNSVLKTEAHKKQLELDRLQQENEQLKAEKAEGYKYPVIHLDSEELKEPIARCGICGDPLAHHDGNKCKDCTWCELVSRENKS